MIIAKKLGDREKGSYLSEEQWVGEDHPRSMQGPLDLNMKVEEASSGSTKDSSKRRQRCMRRRY